MSPSSLIAIILAAFLSAVLSGMGIGSAGIFVLYLTMVAGYPQPLAQAVNLVFFLLSAGASLLFHIPQRTIPHRAVLFFIVCAIPGALAGSLLVRLLDAEIIRRLFGGMLTVTGAYTLLSKDRRRDSENIVT